MARVRRHEPDYLEDMSFHHLGIEVRELDNAIAFYKNLFEIKEMTCMTLGGENVAFLQTAHVLFELVESDSPGRVHFAFQCGNVQSGISRLQAVGCTLIEGPTVYENGWQSAFMKKQDGEVLEVLKR